MSNVLGLSRFFIGIVLCFIFFSACSTGDFLGGVFSVVLNQSGSGHQAVKTLERVENVGFSDDSAGVKTVRVSNAFENDSAKDKVKSVFKVARLQEKYSDRASFSYEKAFAKMAQIENEFWTNDDTGVCKYYGRYWRDNFAKKNRFSNTKQTLWAHYKQALKEKGQKPQQMDCTLYANAILRAGMSRGDYKRLWHEHQKQWPKKGLAGWSVAHLLTRKFGWKAYAMVSPESKEYSYYLSFLNRKREYPVWKQPNIKIADYFILGKDDEKIAVLLEQNGFGWGFSNGGIHTWVTTGNQLKECHFDSGPSQKYEVLGLYKLFETTPFLQYRDYNEHLVVFPPKF